MTPQANPFGSAWQQYVDAGWHPVPLPFQAKKRPPGGFTGREGTNAPIDQLEAWADKGFNQSGQRNLVCNIALRMPLNVIGLDVDHYLKAGRTKSGADQLAEFEARHGSLPPTWTSTRRDVGGPSSIRFYRVPEGTEFPESLSADIDIIQWWHRYAIVWPSVVPDDDDPDTLLAYAWGTPAGAETIRIPRIVELAELTSAQVKALAEFANAQTSDDKATRAAGGSPKEPIWLPLGDPGRNNAWLTRISGRLARLMRGDDFDDFLQFVQLVDGGSTDPHNFPDLEKTAKSVWRKEHAKEVADEGTVTTGYVWRDGDILMFKNDKMEEREFANFRMRVIGKVRDSEGRIEGYNVELTAARTRRTTEEYLPVSTLLGQGTLPRWLAAREVAILAGSSGGASPGVRLGAWLGAQHAPDVRIVPFWGWDDQSQGFVTDQGLIFATGLEPGGSVRPAPDLVQQNLVRHRYGFEFGEDRAVKILREVLTFQDFTATSVAASWWMATRLKGQIMQTSSLFPALVIEAPSESGKTRGFFELMYALDGNLKGQGVSTAAAFRNRLAAHRNGIVWLDDLRELDEKTKEYIRAATGEKEADRSDTHDNRTVLSNRLVAPVMLSGEGFGLDGEKALPDRVIKLELPSPKGRMSLHDPTRPQWDDIVDFKRTHPDLSMAAGTLVKLALECAPMVEQLPALRPSNGRHGDKIAVLRLGARVLAAVTGDDEHIRRVDEWCGELVDPGNENALTKLLIPKALAFWGAWDEPVKLDRPPYHGVSAPVLVRNDRIWVNCSSLADWWERHNRGAEVRTHTAQALMDQAKAIGMKGQKAGIAGEDWVKLRVKDERGKVTAFAVFQAVPVEICAELLGQYGGIAPRVAQGSAHLDVYLANYNRSRPRNPPPPTPHP